MLRHKTTLCMMYILISTTRDGVMMICAMGITVLPGPTGNGQRSQQNPTAFRLSRSELLGSLDDEQDPTTVAPETSLVIMRGH